jgi:PPOX class probable F420-dependent enzyme
MPASIDPATPGGAHARERLATEPIGWLTTVKPDGQPQSSPLWFLWTNDEIFVYSHKTAPRNRNIESNPRVAFNLHTDAGGDDVISMEGTARFDPEGPPCSQHPAYLAKYGSMLESSGGPEFMDRDYPVIIRITPTRWRAG